MKHATMQELAALKRQLETKPKPAPQVRAVAVHPERQAVARDLATRIGLLAQACHSANYTAIKTNRLELNAWIDATLPPADAPTAKHRVAQVIAQVLERSSEVA